MPSLNRGEPSLNETNDQTKSPSRLTSKKSWDVKATPDLQLWPFISYITGYKWDYTFHKWGDKHF
jgi:hypothetical protein